MEAAASLERAREMRQDRQPACVLRTVCECVGCAASISCAARLQTSPCHAKCLALSRLGWWTLPRLLVLRRSRSLASISRRKEGSGSASRSPARSAQAASSGGPQNSARWFWARVAARSVRSRNRSGATEDGCSQASLPRSSASRSLPSTLAHFDARLTRAPTQPVTARFASVVRAEQNQSPAADSQFATHSPRSQTNARQPASFASCRPTNSRVSSLRSSCTTHIR